jgi:hypothetical protein
MSFAWLDHQPSTEVMLAIQGMRIGNTDTGDSLYDKDLEVNDAVRLGVELEGNKSLTRLNLGGNRIGHGGLGGIKAISDALEVNTTLMYINLRGNSIGGNAAEALSIGLRNNQAQPRA